MNIRLFLQSRRSAWNRYRAKRHCLRQSSARSDPIPRTDWKLSLADPLGFYLRAFRYFHRQLPADLRRHRAYFQRARRGFGEDAFHVMWYLLHREFKPQKFLEIGVYRGQVLSLMSLLQVRDGSGGEVVGISPFTSAGDAVSHYREGISYQDDTLRNFRHFMLPPPQLLRAYSTDAEAIALIESEPWDCIYIDGNHDYEVAKADWEICAASVGQGGLIVLDDAALTTAFTPPIFATRGHPGPSQVAEEIDRHLFQEILQVGHNRVFQKTCV